MKQNGVNKVVRKTRTISNQLHVPPALPLERKKAMIPAEQKTSWSLKAI